MDRPRALPNRLAAALVFLASGAVLVLEIVALRLVGPYVGITLQTSSAVIGVALGAIAYGAWTGGWLADRCDPRRLLAPTLVLAGVATALTVPIVRYAGDLLRGSSAGGVLLLVAVGVFPPAALLSAVTPLVVKLQLADLRRTGQVVGRLSGLGTLGAITATLVTGFVLVAALPSSIIMLALAGGLGLVGLALAVHLPTTGPGRGWGGAGRRGRAGLALLGLAGAGLTAIAPTPCDVETAYHCASVRPDPDRPTGRILHLNSAPHSYVDLADARHLEYAYTQWMGALTDVVAPPGQPLRALHLGGGGFTLPGYLAATRPGSRSLVLELDHGLIALDRAELGLRTGPDLRVDVGDARIGLARQPAASWELVVGDAFGHLVVPWHLATRELFAEVDRVLPAGGVLVQNLIDGPPLRFLRSELATVRAVFPHVAVVAAAGALAAGRGGNVVFAASRSPLPVAAWRARLASAATGPVDLLDGAALAAFVGRPRILTDDYAPVDQLRAFG